MVLKASQHNDDLQDQETAMNTRANSDISNNNNSEISYQLTIHDVLGKKESFDAFMLHIVKEFSVEILVSYVEVLCLYIYTHYIHIIYANI